MKPNTVIRVGTMNNFDHTKAEFYHLKQFTKPGHLIFVNSNAHTTIDPTYPSIVTVNPGLADFLPLKGDLSNVKALRVKASVMTCVSSFEVQRYPDHIPILLTAMRFKSQASLNKYVAAPSHKCYEWRGSWFRLKPSVWAMEIEHWKEFPGLRNQVYVCDETGNGCPDCMNCSYLTYGLQDCIIKGLNLSTSGVGGKCQYDCPDCFSKSLLMGGWPKLNSLTQNSKQKGKKG